MTKLLEHIPAYCAACYQHDVELRHIDFEAAYDGGVVIDGEIKQPVDDLVLCENCLHEAFVILDPQGDREEIQRLASLLERAENDIAAKDRMVQRLEKTLNELVNNPIKKRAGSQEYAGVPDEIRAALDKRRDARIEGQRRYKQQKRDEAARETEAV